MTSDRQAAYEERYWERHDRDRPKPATELHELRRLAQRVVDGRAEYALEWAVLSTPENFLLALAAEEWDRRNPLYSCVHCRDGKDLPKGYMCRECGESTGYEGDL